MIIDAHQHFWRIGANDCTWPTPDLARIHRDFEPEDFIAAASGLGVDGSVLVQSQESERDTDWLLDLAARTHFVRAVVGWADLAAPEAPARIAALAARPKLRGLRPMLQGLARDDWIADPALTPAIEAMIAHDLAFDALVHVRHLAPLRMFAARHPRLAIVIDHGAKPPIGAGALSPWREEIATLAALPNVHCKLSGLLTEAGPAWTREALAPYVSHLVNAFGPGRLMWGSDWPVVRLAAEYGEWLDMARVLCAFGASDAEALFSANARAFYRI